MGKARERRLRNRRIYLADLAENNPDQFRREWAKRLHSWSKCISTLADSALAFDGRDIILAELRKCGETAVELEGVETRDIMTDTCVKAVAKIVNPHLFPRSNASFNHEQLILGLAKPPR